MSAIPLPNTKHQATPNEALTLEQHEIIVILKKVAEKSDIMAKLMFSSPMRFKRLLDEIQSIQDRTSPVERAIIPTKSRDCLLHGDDWGRGGVMRITTQNAGKSYPLNPKWMALVSQAIKLGFSPSEMPPAFPSDHGFRFPVGELAAKGGAEGLDMYWRLFQP